MNEITSIFLLYHMLCFSDFVPGATTRYLIGWYFIFFTSLNLTMHIILLIRNTLSNAKQKTFDKYRDKKRAKAKEEREKKAEEKQKMELIRRQNRAAELAIPGFVSSEN